MRRSIPREERKNEEERNSVSKIEKAVENGQNSTVKIRRCTGKHYDKMPMHYGESLKTGAVSGGHIWNPPMECTHRVLVHVKTGDRWIDCHACRSCKNHCGDKQNPACKFEKMVHSIQTPRRRN